MYTFIRGINIHVCQPFVNLKEMFADYVHLTQRPFLGWYTCSKNSGRIWIWAKDSHYSFGSQFPEWTVSRGSHSANKLGFAGTINGQKEPGAVSSDMVRSKKVRAVNSKLPNRAAIKKQAGVFQNYAVEILMNAHILGSFCFMKKGVVKQLQIRLYRSDNGFDDV